MSSYQDRRSYTDPWAPPTPPKDPPRTFNASPVRQSRDYAPVHPLPRAATMTPPIDPSPTHNYRNPFRDSQQHYAGKLLDLTVTPDQNSFRDSQSYAGKPWESNATLDWNPYRDWQYCAGVPSESTTALDWNPYRDLQYEAEKPSALFPWATSNPLIYLDLDGQYQFHSEKHHPSWDTSTKPSKSQDAKVHRVDGGLEAWGVVAGAFCALFVQFGLGESSRTSDFFTIAHCEMSQAIAMAPSNNM
jgi:hypothetical protein